MKKWYVVYTQPQKEMIALYNLCQQHFLTYFPRIKKVRKHARKTDTVLVPFFPRYLFVELDSQKDQWRKVNGTRGVVHLLANNNQPIAIDSSLIDTLKKREIDDAILLDDTTPFFKVGERVLINDGALSGTYADIIKLNNHQRVTLLLSFLGRPLEVDISRQNIEAA